MEELSEGKEIGYMGVGSVLQKLGTARLQSTDAATNAVDTAIPRTGQIPHDLEVGFKQAIPVTGKTAHHFPTAEQAVLRNLQQPGETGTKRPIGVQVKDHRVSKGPLKALPERLQWVATDPSALLREAQVGPLLLPP
jgi:hypothetical protein